MLNRRQVLEVGVSLPLVWAAGHAMAAIPDPAGIAILDGRFPGTQSFAAALAIGTQRLDTRGDFTALWLRHFSGGAERPSVLIGLTSEQALFGLDQMLRRADFRLVHCDEVGVEDDVGASFAAAGRVAMQAARQAGRRWRPMPLRLGPTMREPAVAQVVPFGWVMARRNET